ncbi:MAG: VWA domain-containing protein [Chloroflexi bacterium]|nr:VWA domain-containing protein [Chloroflexota bacterium]
MRMRINMWIGLAGLMIVGILVGGCAASQDASKSYSRAVINRGAIVPADTIRVAEYLNYYEQRFPEPVGQPLALDLRLGNPTIPLQGGEVWLQIGIQAKAAELRERTPLNLALVIDRSGSMNDYNKMHHVKQSLEVFLQSLHPDDIVAIVVYNEEAQVARSAQHVGDGSWILQTVQGITPNKGTNLHAGLMQGFGEVDKNFDIRRNNRVILLTGGIANKGVTDPATIAADALAYSERGIYLSTIGLGLDLNDDLLSTLARQGHGAYHFIDSAEEMDKVFRAEVDGLVERVANDVSVSIRPALGVSVTSITGLVGRAPIDGAQVKLQAMGSGDSQALMVRLQVSPRGAGQQPLADITLDYADVFAQRPRSLHQQVSVRAQNLAMYDPLADNEVRRNATIVRSAEALKTIDALFNDGQYRDAWELANAMENDLRAMAQVIADPRMVEDADLFRRYQLTLSQALGYDPTRGVHPAATDNGQPQRWGVATPVGTQLPEVEIR